MARAGFTNFVPQLHSHHTDQLTVTTTIKDSASDGLMGTNKNNISTYWSTFLLDQLDQKYLSVGGGT